MLWVDPRKVLFRGVTEFSAPTRYKTAGPPTNATIRNCRWQSAKDDSGELRSIISSGDTQGPGSVTVKAGEFFQTSGGCTWTRQ